MNSKLCPCSDFHESCIQLIIGKFLRHLKYSLRIYPLVHSIPLFLTKFSDFKIKGKEIFKNYFVNILCSTSFFTLYMTILRAVLCFDMNSRGGKFDFFSVFGICFLPSFAVLLEKSSRVLSFIIFTLPRSLEGIWDLMHKLGFPISFDDSVNFIFALTIAALLLMYKKNEKDFPSSYSKIMKFIYKE